VKPSRLRREGGRHVRASSRFLIAFLSSLSLLASACAPVPVEVRRQAVAPGEVPVQLGTAPRHNFTPLEASLACFARALSASGRPPIVVGVGEVKDFTGRYSINEGNVVTQGGSLMLYSALGKMGGAVRIAERQDSSIAERELAFMDRRQLGNGDAHDVNGQRVPWLPYFGGTVQASDYYIVGGITEVNYNIASGGVEAGLDNIGFKGRTYTQSIAIDLRIVDSRSLIVVDAISLTKQFTGYEVGANTFRVFGLGLVNINLGAKGQEPLQLGIRATLEEAAMRLVGRVTEVDPRPCLERRSDEIQTRTSEDVYAELLQAEKTATAVPRGAGGRSVAASGAAGANGAAGAGTTKIPIPGFSSVYFNDSQDAGQAAATFSLTFDVGATGLSAATLGVLDRAAAAARQGRVVSLTLLAPDAEKLEPGQRNRLLDQRIASLTLALAGRGVPAGAVSVSWRPSNTESTVYREVPGLQLIARIRLMR
jgi:curli biogenesis system outer membrane secretion channel CsgG